MNMSMSCIFWLQILCFLDAAFVGSTAQSISKQSRKYEHLNILIEDLQSQGWDAKETRCFELLLKIVRNAQNSTVWATWIWDSMQNPIGHLYRSKYYNYGKYDECLDFPWEKVHPDMKTQYCLANIKLPEVDLQLDETNLFGNANDYLRAKSKHYLNLNTLNWGICTPVACKPRSIAKFVSVMFRHTRLGLAGDRPNITIEHCDTAEDKDVRSYDWGCFFTVIFLTFTIVFAISVTHVVITCNLDNTYSDLLKCFYIPTNIHFLKKVTSNDVRSLFGLKVLCCLFITGLHVSWTIKTWTIGSASSIDKDDIRLPLTLTTEIVLDTFLFMSGLIFIKSLVTEGAEKFNPWKTVVKRYIRITRNSFLIILITLTLSKYIPKGPEISQIFNSELEACRKNWWASLLMIHNYFDTGNICHPVSWSLAVDFHLSVIATMIYWVYSRNKKYGIRLFLISLMASIAIPAVLVYYDYQRFRPLTIDIRIVRNFRDVVFKNETYINTHLRAVSYFVGMAMGYMMVTYNPNIYRNSIAKKYSLLGFCLVLATFIGIFVINNRILKHDYTPMEGALYLSLRRFVWAILIGILITICEYGTLSIVNDFLSWSAWVPISKLTPGIYHVNLMLGPLCSGTTRGPSQYDLIGVVISICGVSAVSIVLSLIMWTFYEAPVQNLTSLLLRSGKKQVTRDAITDVNGNGIISEEQLSNKKKI